MSKPMSKAVDELRWSTIQVIRGDVIMQAVPLVDAERIVGELEARLAGMIQSRAALREDYEDLHKENIALSEQVAELEGRIANALA